eukprot:TRINITY_DN114171_c0_g1_i1.p1 TRINITY_DN114171_c0_g1~~TRINITY_DN114171_c0_g1_i1.p1  ORF type:complete len:170 (-),score=51.05 TRINITY_DN114171_c0_g1_i1:116-625(-)
MAAKPAYTFNLNEALDKKWETKSFTEIADSSLENLQGLGPVAKALFEDSGLKTVRQLATWKYYLLAKAFVGLKDAEEDGKRDPAGEMNFNNGVDKAWETKSIKEICEAPPSALQGLSEKADGILQKKPLNVKTIEQLASLKFCRWAESIVELAKYEVADHSSSKRQKTA